MIKKIIRKIYFLIFKEATYWAIKRANREKKLTNYKMVVMKVAGWPKVYKKKDLKGLVAMHRFKKGTTVDSLMRNALYITN